MVFKGKNALLSEKIEKKKFRHYFAQVRNNANPP